MFTSSFQLVFLVVIALLLLGAVVRWSRTAEQHPDHAARGDMMRLLAVLLVGQVLMLGRERVVPASPAFWLLNLLLLLPTGLALILLWRLVRAYRRPPGP